MRRPLVLARDQEFVDDLLDRLGSDVEVDVALGSLSAEQSRQAPLVLADSRTLAGAHRHPNLAVIISSALVGDRLALHYRLARHVFPGVDVHQWPDGAEAVRRLIVTAPVEPRPEVRVGVIGGHGGAGATTLAVALALAAVRDGLCVVLVDADPLGGVCDRMGRLAPRPRVVEYDGVPGVVQADRLVQMIERAPAEVKVVDLSRSLDVGQLAAADVCDIVLVVADVGRNERATRQVLRELAENGVSFALVPRCVDDEMAQDLASDFAVTLLDAVPRDPRSLLGDGRIHVIEGCDLLSYARELLSRVPGLSATAAL